MIWRDMGAKKVGQKSLKVCQQKLNHPPANSKNREIDRGGVKKVGQKSLKVCQQKLNHPPANSKNRENDRGGVKKVGQKLNHP
jgi:hypothetical protein